MAPGEEFDAVLAAAQVGQEWAFGLLYQGFNPRLLRYLGVYAPAAAEDLAAETWLGVARRLHAFRGDESAFAAWLFTIGRARLVEHWRDRGRRPASPVAPDALDDHPDPGDVETRAIEGVSAQAAARAIARALSPDQADVVLLRVLGGLDVDQVARLLGKRPGTVRVLQHKALRRLARTFSFEALTR